MILRLSKIAMVMAIAFFASLVAFGNITDYGTNFAFVHHVFEMDTIFPDATIKYRSITTPWIQQFGYIAIIALETLTAVLCWVGAFILLKNLKTEGQIFNKKKNVAIAGLTLGFLVWQVGFMSVGGEWFGMWMSSQWNGVPDAFRFFITIILVLIYLVQKDRDLE
ncbi:DUF2165 family protein [Zophobihabitans entericus]|uniref:DUF2165 domain-containing protein n=1 Tax=Zophobihabitans entericus TaxID=1635327 RepID=A0A6G9I9T7_9GAMM|nr:DUF2165 domain-containing protein [Zophobihabitans entericus]QIQ20995.1 DUF2165 domain-containing protein [Zophobihabitans entericus]